MKTKRDFYKMIAERRRNIIDHTSDCIGTGLYLVGEKETDYIGVSDGVIMNNLKTSKKPEVGYLAAWRDHEESVYHLATIVKKNPLTLSTRNGAGYPFTRNELFEKTHNGYTGYPRDTKFKDVKFLIPSKLQKILGIEKKLK